MNKVIIDVSNVKTISEFHSLLKVNLEFPNFYGMNWDAFWDAITGLVEMPNILEFKGFTNIEENFPKDTLILKKLFEDFEIEFPQWCCEVIYN